MYQRSTGGTPVPHGMRRLFVGCVTRPERFSHRAQITPPRNTPEPKPLPVTNPWCVRGAGFHASSSHAVTTRPYPSASCVTSPRLTHPTGLYQHMHGRDDKPLRRVCDAARAILAPRANHSAAEHTRTKAPSRYQPLEWSRSANGYLKPLRMKKLTRRQDVGCSQAQLFPTLSRNDLIPHSS